MNIQNQSLSKQITAALEAAEEYGVATDYAKRLAVSLWDKHYREHAPNWKPLDDLYGILTQIDNMICGLKTGAA